MDHQQATELLSPYLDGELEPTERQALEAHLEGCDACRQELEALERTLRTLAGLAPVAPPKDFGRKVQQRIRKRSRGRFFNGGNWLTRVPFEWISFVIIMLMLVMYYMLALQAQVKRVHPAPPKAPVSDTLPAPGGHQPQPNPGAPDASGP